jgi:hypothetical protein
LQGTIDARSDISEADLRRQFGTGYSPPSDATMIAFYDNVLPIACVQTERAPLAAPSGDHWRLSVPCSLIGACSEVYLEYASEARSDATMIAFYDNALPIAYTTMRQHARRANHKTLLVHHMDIMSQVRAEVNSRAPAPNAFAAAVAPAPGANADADKTCLRCGRLGHTRRTCR